jgi:hypothetical protein
MIRAIYRPLTGLCLLLVLVAACDQKSEPAGQSSDVWKDLPDTTTEAPSFFPVSSYILGQLNDLESTGVSLKKIILKNASADTSSASLQELIDSLKILVVHPIDSIKLGSFFKERKFNDQTIGSITLSYDRLPEATDSIPWKNWDVYLDPETGEIKRVFLVHQIDVWTKRQITWVPGRSCRFVIIQEKLDCNKPEVRQVTYQWGN